MGLTQRRQAIHDVLTGTTVRLAIGAAPMPGDDMVDLSAGRELPSRLRRFVIIVLYLALGFVLASVATAFALGDCLQDVACGEDGEMLSDAIGLAWFAASAVAIVAGWRGRLPGARGRRLAPSSLARNDG